MVSEVLLNLRGHILHQSPLVLVITSACGDIVMNIIIRPGINCVIEFLGILYFLNVDIRYPVMYCNCGLYNMILLFKLMAVEMQVVSKRDLFLFVNV